MNRDQRASRRHPWPLRCFTILSFLAVGFALPAYAEAYRTVNNLVVVPLNADSFEVFDGGRAGARGIWCAAGDYTRAIGRDVPQQKLYLATPRGPSTRQPNQKSTVFTLVPGNGVPTDVKTYSLTTSKVGANILVSQTFQYCRDIFTDQFDIFR